MEGGFSGNTVLPNSNEKLRVLNVKPLRMLVPQFPDSSEGHPFVCVPPDGPFPSGFSPFFPFSVVPQGSQSTPDLSRNGIDSTATPIGSFRTENVSPMDTQGSHKKKLAGSGSVKKKKKTEKGSKLSFTAASNFDPGISLPDRDDGNRELVENVLLRFDALRRKLCQIEDTMESHSGCIRRADLKTGNTMMSKGVRTNIKKRVGVVPGVEIGDIFFFRFELCLVGLHSPSMGGIDYMKDDLGELLALSIVSSGGYDNDAEDPDILIYSGQGGTAGRDKEASDQKLERGNLALEKSLHRGNEIRVIRGLKDTIQQSSKVYVYDGLYKIQESWMEKGKSGCNMFKYKLARIPGQTGAFTTWKSILKSKGVSSRAGLILSDLTSGAESIPVSLVNEVDDANGPAYFTFFPTVKYSKSFGSVQSTLHCDCRDACQPGNCNCSCIQNNAGDFPYTGHDVLVCRKPLIYECGPSCPCARNCKNRASQTGLKFHLEVFKTTNRGWGLRSRDPIRAGSFICEYAGEVIDNQASQAGGYGEIDDYIFYTNRHYESFKWNYEPELVGEESSNAMEDFYIPSPLSISAKNIGNVARFMNHSCTPNMFWQPIMYEQNNEAYLHIGFFAKKHIPPMTELTYDYGTPYSNVTESYNNTYGRKKCFCGSQKCRGYFY